MKKIAVFVLSMLLVGSFTSCSNDTTETNGHTISGYVVNRDGQGVMSVTLDLSGDAEATTTTNSQGIYQFTGLEDGDYSITPSSPLYDFNPELLEFPGLTADNDKNAFVAIGIYGSWASEGENVAPILREAPLNVESQYATFNTNGTYQISRRDTSGTQITLAGTFSIEKSGVPLIYNIVLNQSTYAVITETGIFSIDATSNPYIMTYEVVQTEPAIGHTPPTAIDGFGSTDNGALGSQNIQIYLRQ